MVVVGIVSPFHKVLCDSIWRIAESRSLSSYGYVQEATAPRCLQNPALVPGGLAVCCGDENKVLGKMDDVERPSVPSRRFSVRVMVESEPFGTCPHVRRDAAVFFVSCARKSAVLAPTTVTHLRNAFLARQGRRYGSSETFVSSFLFRLFFYFWVSSVPFLPRLVPLPCLWHTVSVRRSVGAWRRETTVAAGHF